MARTVLLTGFGPFPGAPVNPTDSLVQALVRRHDPTLIGVRRVAYVFRTSYRAVDKEFPALLARVKPEVLVMFGLASRNRRLRIETRARNARSLVMADADGELPQAVAIEEDGPEWLDLRAPAQRLAMAVRMLGLPAETSRDAGGYLCNYLCWRAGESAMRPGGPRIVTFVHVPPIDRTGRPQSQRLDLADLIRAGEAIIRTALLAARAAR
jgi:pyroglutamyl-peptidase